jgi:hypothetical protein
MAFECKIAADSLAPCGARLTTFIVTYPRAIHSEIMTHRILTKSSASSRAIPTEKLIQRVLDDPWIPDYIGKNQKGMQAGEALSEDDRARAIENWLDLRDQAVAKAKLLNAMGVHKQISNRILEPWMWITVIISGTEWDNFFGLRTHEAAEPHFQHIARMMKSAREESEPKRLAAGEWHTPLIFDEDREDKETFRRWGWDNSQHAPDAIKQLIASVLVKVSVGRCARVSYLNHEGKRDLQADIDLHDRLMVQRPLHAAPAEHVAQAMDWPSWVDEVYDEFGQSGTDVYKLRQAVVERRRDGVRTELPPSQGSLRAQAALGQLTSGNYLGFKQYRKTLTDEHIGGLMP